MRRLLTFALGASVLLAACAPAALPATDTPVPTNTPVPTATRPPTAAPPTATAAPLQPVAPDVESPFGAKFEFTTDFTRHSVPYSEILSGGPPKDGIPAIDDPKFVSVAEADAWLEDVEPVVLFEAGGEARAYPIQILMWHEIVNDTVGGVPAVVTFCPLCNTAIAFERTVDGRELDFGTTGRLRFSNLIMYDRQTETWWQQATGEAIAGEMTGTWLRFLPATIIAWADFAAAYPEARVLSRDTGFGRNYGANPYAGYDDVNRPPFLYRGPATPGVLPPVARVLTVDLNREAVAYPYDVLAELQVISDTVGGTPIVVVWVPGTASALDARTVAGGRDVGAANAFSRTLDSRTLTFVWQAGQIVDEQTGSAWNVLGEAVEGPRAGQRLTPVVAINHFWFSWAAFKPDTRIYQAP